MLDGIYYSLQIKCTVVTPQHWSQKHDWEDFRSKQKSQKDWKRTYYCNAGKRYFLWLFFSAGDPDPLVRDTDPDPDPSLFSYRCSAD